jgi:two-component system sensor histidine kinase BaeS
MFNTLRFRFILSHLLPTLVVVPLLGLALFYILQTQVLVANLSEALTGEAVVVAAVAAEYPTIWIDQSNAQVFVDRIGPRLQARAMLIAPNRTLWASSDPADAALVGRPADIDGLSTALTGQLSTRLARDRSLDADIFDVLVPVVGLDQNILGVIRLSHPLSDVYQRYAGLRYLVAGILAAGLILGAVVGLLLAINLERPLRQATQAVYHLTRGERSSPLPERGPQEMRLLLRAVNTLVERLHALEESRRKLLANLVHELGRPLGALRSAIQALQGGADQETALRGELLTGMDGEIGRLRRLLDDLSQLYGQVLGPLELDRRPTALSDWLNGVLPAWREAAQAKGLDWQTAIPPDLPSLEIDPDRLAQAVGNLLSNAVKFTPAGGAVSVAAGLDGRDAWIRVGDTGPGIPPEEQARVFEPFYRSQAGRRFPQGMGLGLTIARDLVAAHSGRLEVDSAPGQGSRFTIWLKL